MDGIHCAGCSPYKKVTTSPEIGPFLAWAKKNAPPKKGALPFQASQLDLIKKTLQSLIVFHLEKEPKSLHFLKNQS